MLRFLADIRTKTGPKIRLPDQLGLAHSARFPDPTCSALSTLENQEQWLSKQPRAFQKGYNSGYDDGHDDGAELNEEGDNYEPKTSLRGKRRRQFLEGYEEGYHQGYLDGRDEYRDEAEAAEYPDDYY